MERKTLDDLKDQIIRNSQKMADYMARVESEPLAVVADVIGDMIAATADHNATCENCPRPKKLMRDFMDDVLLDPIALTMRQSLDHGQMLLQQAVNSVEDLSELPADNPERLRAATNLAHRAYTQAAMMRMTASVLDAFVRTQMRRKPSRAHDMMVGLAEQARQLAKHHADAVGKTPNPQRKPVSVRVN